MLSAEVGKTRVGHERMPRREAPPHFEAPHFPTALQRSKVTKRAPGHYSTRRRCGEIRTCACGRNGSATIRRRPFRLAARCRCGALIPWPLQLWEPIISSLKDSEDCTHANYGGAGKGYITFSTTVQLVSFPTNTHAEFSDVNPLNDVARDKLEKVRRLTAL